LREAFTRMTKDPDYIAEAKSLNFGPHPLDGVELQKLAETIANTPTDIVAKFLVAATPKR